MYIVHAWNDDDIWVHDLIFCDFNYLKKGSSKGMEPNMACSIINNMAKDGFAVGTLHADNDTTTQSRLPPTIQKRDDISHVKKNLSSRLYRLSKTYKS